jgi:hypothetical protein
VQQQREAASRLFDSNGEANRVRNKQNRAIIADGPVRVPVILPKAVTTTDTDEFSVKSADYSVNNDLPSSSPSGKTVLMILCGLVGFFVFVVLAVEFRSTLGFG